MLPTTCGLRQGEYLALRFEDIDFTKGTLQVRRTVFRNQVYPPKTPHSRRTIILLKIALDAFERHARNNNNAREGGLFLTKHGNPVENCSITLRGYAPMIEGMDGMGATAMDDVLGDRNSA